MLRAQPSLFSEPDSRFNQNVLHEVCHKTGKKQALIDDSFSSEPSDRGDLQKPSIF